MPNTDPDGMPTQRLKMCANPDCNAAFTLCVSCDRGQRYCGPACRAFLRRGQSKAANQRYQQTVGGRDAHRRCQQRYREHASHPLTSVIGPVTDQHIPSVTMPSPSLASAAPAPLPPKHHRCTICGKHSRWIDPFPPIPRSLRRRLGRRLKNYAFS